MARLPLAPLGLTLALLAVAAPAAAQDHGAHGQQAQGSQPAQHAMQHSSGWQALDDFHMLMMATWHPAKQRDDLAPTREKAAAMAEAAAAWMASSPPEKCATYEAGKVVATVAADSRALAGMVQGNATDAELKTALAALHETFEKVMHGCAGGAGDGGH